MKCPLESPTGLLQNLLLLWNVLWRLCEVSCVGYPLNVSLQHPSMQLWGRPKSLLQAHPSLTAVPT